MLSIRDLDTDIGGLGKRTIIIEAVTLFLATVGLCLRLWARSIGRRSLCLNDYFIMFAWPLTLGLFATAIITIVDEEAAHSFTDPLVQSSFKSILASDYLWAAAITFIKLSILHLYISLFPQQVFRLLSYLMMGVVTSFGVAIILTRSFLCANIEMQWNWNANNKCGSNWAAMLAESVINALINTVIICMPMPILWRLKMGVDRKILLTIVFGVGIIAVSITILRFVSVAQASDDWQSAVVRVALWTNLEAMLGILCACLPLIRPAVARVFYLATGRVALQSSSKPTPAISSTVARIRQKSHAGNQSQGIMEDQYPLTEGRNWRDPEHTTGARTNTTAVGKREVERKGNVVSQSPEDRIRVQSEWYVTRE